MRELERQIAALLFDRLSMNKNPEQELRAKLGREREEAERGLHLTADVNKPGNGEGGGERSMGMSPIGDLLELSSYGDMCHYVVGRRHEGPAMRIRNATELGLFIRDRRRALGLDQKTLAERAGVGRQWIVAVEKGRPRAEVGLLLRTIEALGLRILVDEGEPKAPTKSGKNRRPEIDLDAVIARARGGA